MYNGDPREVDGMGFIVPAEGGLVCHEVVVIFEERESRRKGAGDQGTVLEEKSSTACEDTSRIVVVGSGQASKQGESTGRRQIDGEMFGIAPSFARFIESAAGQQQRARQHRRSDEYEEVRRIELERAKRDSDREGRAAEHGDGEAESDVLQKRGGRSRERAAG